jgi:predicted ATPase/class 3 adenylate cyclase
MAAGLGPPLTDLDAPPIPAHHPSAEMRDLPAGTVTLLFTDIEGSTRLLRELGTAYADVLAQHRRLLRESFAHHGGVEVDTQGDAFFVAFRSADGAVAAALESQSALEAGPIRVRIGLHTGRPMVTDEGYVGLDVHMAARICAAAHGGQVIASGEARALLDDSVAITDLGEHRLKDFDDPLQLFQLGEAWFPPLRTISNTNLPRPASSFVGREGAVSEVVSLLRADARLVTLSGPGGAGKTRLSIEAAAELVPEFRAGVFWIELAPVRDPALVLSTVAQTLGAKEDLAKHIGEREMLLLIDNFEHVVEAAADVAGLLRACPNLKVLVTSRELLRVRGEVEYPIPPLARTEAVELFCARANTEPSDEIADLCARLDDLPLAVELAAARTRVLSPAQILERLSQRLDLFRGTRDSDARQQTLRATIEWSHDLLSEGERLLFARLAAFVGGCTVEAAEAVCDADLDTLQSLVDKSLVRRTGDRFWMLETIREYALERLEASGEAAEIRQRAFGFFLTLAESADLSEDTEGRTRFDLVLPEIDNLRAALDWATARGEIEPALRMAVALELAWSTISIAEGIRRLSSLLERAGGLPERLRARALRTLSGPYQRSGDGDAAERVILESLAMFRSLGDEDGVAQLLHRLGVNAMYRGDHDRARSLLEESLQLARRLGRPRIEAVNIGSLGDLEYREGNHAVGFDLLQRSADLSEEAGHLWWQSVMLSTLSARAMELGQAQKADTYGRQALELSSRMHDQVSIAWSLATLAWSAAVRGEARRAGTLWGAFEAEEARSPIGGWEEGERERYEDALSSAAAPALERGRARGRLLSLEDAVEVALGDPDIAT